MKLLPIAIASIAFTSVLTRTSLAADAEFKPIEDAMKFAHKAPKGTPKLSDKIIDGTVSVTGPPPAICSRNSGTTEPREASTLP